MSHPILCFEAYITVLKVITVSFNWNLIYILSSIGEFKIDACLAAAGSNWTSWISENTKYLVRFTIICKVWVFRTSSSSLWPLSINFCTPSINVFRISASSSSSLGIISLCWLYSFWNNHKLTNSRQKEERKKNKENYRCLNSRNVLSQSQVGRTTIFFRGFEKSMTARSVRSLVRSAKIGSSL